MFVFIKEIFLTGLLFLSSLVSISVINQTCKVRPENINLNSNEPVLYPFSIKTSKCSGSCNNINDPYPYVNVKIFNLISRTNETRHMNCMKRVSVIVNSMQVFVLINNVGMMINVDVNATN